ncbi:hypothetical protein KKB18_04755 [bacterium]|nr:hypothetical protein [bacterium]
MKFLSITLITALIVAGAVLVGVPEYQAWTDTTTDCLYDPSISQVPVQHPDYPCGYIFTIKHYGFCEDESPCHCAHQPLEGVYVKIVDPRTSGVVYTAAMECISIADDCSDSGVPPTNWKVGIHVPIGKYNEEREQFEWEYYFTCDGGSRLPLSGNYYFATSTSEDCEGFVSYPE